MREIFDMGGLTGDGSFMDKSFMESLVSDKDEYIESMAEKRRQLERKKDAERMKRHGASLEEFLTRLDEHPFLETQWDEKKMILYVWSSRFPRDPDVEIGITLAEIEGHEITVPDIIDRLAQEIRKREGREYSSMGDFRDSRKEGMDVVFPNGSEESGEEVDDTTEKAEEDKFINDEEYEESINEIDQSTR